jgi:hypothetical protein
MAGAGYKLFQTGDVLTAAQVNTYLNEQTVMVFANAAARTSALTSVLAEGMVSYLQETNAVEVYTGSAWVGVSGTGDVTEVQAGTGISVASGTGPIPVVTNTMATAVDAKGDLIVGTGADTFARLAVGTNGHTLVADSAETTGLKWQASSSGALTLISRSSFSAVTDTSTTFDAMFTTTYKAYRVVVEAISSSATPPIVFRWQWRKSGPSTHTANYYAGSSRVNFSAAQTLAGDNNQAQYSLDAIGSTASNAYSFDIYRVGQGTNVQPLIYGMGTGYSGNIGPYTFAGTLDATINTTGFILSAASGTITGTVAVYGLATA